MAIGACFGGPLLSIQLLLLCSTCIHCVVHAVVLSLVIASSDILLGIGLGSIIKSLGREGFAFKVRVNACMLGHSSSLHVHYG